MGGVKAGSSVWAIDLEDKRGLGPGLLISGLGAYQPTSKTLTTVRASPKTCANDRETGISTHSATRQCSC